MELAVTRRHGDVETIVTASYAERGDAFRLTGGPMGGCCGGGRSVAHGIAGLTKAALRLDRAPFEDIRSRAAICVGADGQKGACEMLQWGLICSKCNCLVTAKIRVASERCPLDKWTEVRVGGGGNHDVDTTPTARSTPM
jgi:hypothetical protein